MIFFLFNRVLARLYKREARLFVGSASVKNANAEMGFGGTEILKKRYLAWSICPSVGWLARTSVGWALMLASLFLSRAQIVDV